MGRRCGVICEAGIDTARMLFRLWDERQQAAALDWCAEGSKPLVSDDAGALGLKVGYHPLHELLWVEGRPIQALKGRTPQLLPAGALPDAHSAVLARVRDVFPDARPAGLSRIDVTATVQLEDPSQGWAVLRGVGALDVPRRKPALYLDGSGTHPQTVYWLTESGKVRERVYDKGAQLGTEPPGIRIRLEAQTRYRTATRTTAEHWTMERVRETFEQRFGTMARAADGISVCSERALRAQLREYVQRGRLTARQAELLLGHLACESAGIDGRPRRTVRRRRAELRALGLAQALDGIDEADELRVDLGELLADAMTSERWQRG